MVTATLLEHSLLNELRALDQERPEADLDIAGELRRKLADALATLTSPRTVTVRDVRFGPGVASMADASLARVRGVLVSYALRLLIVSPSHVDAATTLAAWRATSPNDRLLAFYDSLDGDARARLLTDVTAHAVTLRRALGPVPARWPVQVDVHGAVPLTPHGVVARDVVDLAIGNPWSTPRSRVLLDVTTGLLDESAPRVLGYHALVDTLRFSRPPRQSALFSTADGAFINAPVTNELLRESAAVLIETVRSDS